ncbi:MAG: PAS domain-containing protein, partial [Hyphomicrobiaceae bacterium]|nr:PAS domain-containing protein [Hyphomicrobiaceae bacterium]
MFDPQTRVEFANKNFLDAMGYTLSEVVGKPHAMFVDPAERDSAAYQAFWDDLRSGKPKVAEFRRIAKSGADVWIQASYNPIRDRLGNIRKVVKIATVITEQKLKAADHKGQIDAIHRSQAVIEFALDGTILTANDNFLKAMGYTLDEIAGRHHSLFVSASERQSAAYRTFWDELAAGKYKAAEFERFAKDGRSVWIQASYNPIFDPDGRPIKVVKFATDITSQKLRQADADGKIAAMDKAQAVIEFEPDGTILHANENFLTAMGYRLEEIVGKHHRIFMGADFVDSAEYRTFWQDLQNGKFHSREFKRFSKSNEPIWIRATYNPIHDPAGRIVKVVKFATDITAEIAAREKFEILSLVANETDNSVIITDPEGRIEYTNPGFERMTGYTGAEVIGRKPGDFLQGAGTDGATVAAISASLSRRAPFYGEILNYTKAGEPYWISLSINPVFNAKGTIVRFISIQANITATKQRQLEDATRLDAIGTANAICEWDAHGRLKSANNFLRDTGA